MNMGRISEAADDGRRALAVARELAYPVGEALALAGLRGAATLAGDHDEAVRLARHAEPVTARIPGVLARLYNRALTGMLITAGDLAAADRIGAAGLAQAQEAGDMWNQSALLPRIADLDLRAAALRTPRRTCGKNSSSPCGRVCDTFVGVPHPGWL
jgi:hypothetical protein